MLDRDPDVRVLLHRSGLRAGARLRLACGGGPPQRLPLPFFDVRPLQRHKRWLVYMNLNDRLNLSRLDYTFCCTALVAKFNSLKNKALLKTGCAVNP